MSYKNLILYVVLCIDLIFPQVSLKFPSWFLQMPKDCQLGYGGDPLRDQRVKSDSLDLQQRYYAYEDLVVAGFQQSYQDDWSWYTEDSVYLYPKVKLSTVWDSTLKIQNSLQISGRQVSLSCPKIESVVDEWLNENESLKPIWINHNTIQLSGVGVSHYNRFNEVDSWIRCEENAIYNLARTISVQVMSLQKNTQESDFYLDEKVFKENILVELKHVRIKERWFESSTLTLYCLAVANSYNTQLK